LARAAPTSPDGEAVARFEALYRAHYRDLLAYVLRRAAPDMAADLVAETFLVAWRRIDELPTDKARLWLFGVARRVLANHHRSLRRTADLAARLRNELASVTASAEPDAAPYVSRAFDQLSEADQEILRLVAWEELTPREVAVVLGCTVSTARVRLHRARRRFASALRETSPHFVATR
jgi:RNA polymerase sigma-70 factor (ECF subfamily)